MTGSPAAERDTVLSECRSARNRYALLFGEEAPRADVELGDTLYWRLSVPEDRVRFVMTSDSVFAAREPEADRIRSRMPGGGRFLSHELLHLFFWLRSGNPTEIDSATQYGTHVPDWFDEGIAVWGESEELRAYRWEQLRSLPDSALDLRGVSAQVHPNLEWQTRTGGVSVTTIEKPNPCSTPECGRDPGRIPEGVVIRTRVFASGESIVDTIPEPMAGPAGLIAKNMYPLAYGLVRYVHDRGGPVAIREVVRRFAGGWPPPESVFVEIPGLPEGLEAAAEDWRQWIRGTGPERGPASVARSGAGREEE